MHLLHSTEWVNVELFKGLGLCLWYFVINTTKSSQRKQSLVLINNRVHNSYQHIQSFLTSVKQSMPNFGQIFKLSLDLLLWFRCEQ